MTIELECVSKRLTGSIYIKNVYIFFFLFYIRDGSKLTNIKLEDAKFDQITHTHVSQKPTPSIWAFF